MVDLLIALKPVFAFSITVTLTAVLHEKVSDKWKFSAAFTGGMLSAVLFSLAGAK